MCTKKHFVPLIFLADQTSSHILLVTRERRYRHLADLLEAMPWARAVVFPSALNLPCQPTRRCRCLRRAI